MARVFITGSADGLGLLAAQLLLQAGHHVVLHARNATRVEVARAAAPGAEAVVTGDLSSLAEMRKVAEQVNQLGRFDAVIHNVGVGYREARRGSTPEGWPLVLAVNSLAPYVLTCLIERPARLVYLSSGLHLQGDATLRDLTWDARPWNGTHAYADSKLHDVLLTFAVARRWPRVLANALTPGWVATRMGGRSAPDSLADAPKTQVWLATSQEPAALVTGQYFYHQQPGDLLPAARAPTLQDRFLAECARLTGIGLPA